MHILSDGDVVPADRMMARFVEASLINDMKEHQLWKGWDEERLKPRKPTQRNQGSKAGDVCQASARTNTGTDRASKGFKRMRRNPESDACDQHQDEEPDIDALIQEFLNNDDIDGDGTQNGEQGDADSDNDDIEHALAKLLQEAAEADGLPVEVEVEAQEDENMTMPNIPDNLLSVEPVPDALALLLEDADRNPAAPAAAAAAAAGGVPRASKVAEDVLDIPRIGEIRYNERQFFRAHCSVHGPDCRRQRQSVAGKRAGAGRPLGALTAWLQSASTYRTAADHIAAKSATYKQRQDARALLKTCQGADRFFGYERRHDPSDLGDGEEPLKFT